MIGSSQIDLTSLNKKSYLEVWYTFIIGALEAHESPSSAELRRRPPEDSKKHHDISKLIIIRDNKISTPHRNHVSWSGALCWDVRSQDSRWHALIGLMVVQDGILFSFFVFHEKKKKATQISPSASVCIGITLAAVSGILHTSIGIVGSRLSANLGISSQSTLSPQRRHPPTPAAFSQPCLVAIATKEA